MNKDILVAESRASQLKYFHELKYIVMIFTFILNLMSYVFTSSGVLLKTILNTVNTKQRAQTLYERNNNNFHIHTINV